MFKYGCEVKGRCFYLQRGRYCQICVNWCQEKVKRGKSYIFNKYLSCIYLHTTQYQFSSVSQSCPALCNPMDYSMPGLPVHHQLPEFTQTHIHESVMSSNQLILCHPPFSSHLQSFPASGYFQMSQFFSSGVQGFGVSASASVLPMNIQD